MVKDNSPSDFKPEEGDTLHHDSDDETLQSRFAVNETFWVPPCSEKLMLLGVFITSKGAFSHEGTTPRIQQIRIAREICLFIVDF